VGRVFATAGTGPASQLAIDGRNVDAAAPLGGTIEFGSADLTRGRHIFTFQLAAAATGLETDLLAYSELGKLTSVVVSDKPAEFGAVRVGLKVMVSTNLDPAVAGRITACDEYYYKLNAGRFGLGRPNRPTLAMEAL